MFGLCDCNNFFASCERAFNPLLESKPVIVLSNNDGCVIARSNEAKALGIKMGHPFFQITRLCDENSVNIFSSNSALYSDMSHRVISVLREYVPEVEVYSIDEAFLDFTHTPIVGLSDLGTEIAATVKRSTGIPVSVGIAPTKTLAKIASKLCKQYPKLRGSCLLSRPEDIEKVLHNFSIGDVWGIGRRFAKNLLSIGVVTAWDFTQMKRERVRQIMGVAGLRVWEELRGTPCIDIECGYQAKQQICVSRSFAGEIETFEELRSSIVTFASMCAAKLRSQKSVCSSISVFIYTNPFSKTDNQHYENRIVILEQATDNTAVIAKEAVKALSTIYKKGLRYKKVGVVLCDIYSKSHLQRSL
ncbi:MAG: Y-family DNA polymerase, partial [Bacteroidales bacterium]